MKTVHLHFMMPVASYRKNHPDNINHPKHYSNADEHYEPINVIEAWELGFCLGNTIKYIARHGKKPTTTLSKISKKQLGI